MEKKLYMRTDSGLVELHALTSDTHYGHKNIAVFCDRPFDNSESTSGMDQTLIENYNRIISPDETVLHLGDVALGVIEDSLSKIGELNGRKALTPGNHDYLSFRMSKTRQERAKELYAEYFDWILPESGVILEAHLDGVVKLAHAGHYPSTVDIHEKKDRYASMRPDGSLPIIHGHTHSKSVEQEDYPREYHVGVDAHDLSPVRAEVIVDWIFSI